MASGVILAGEREPRTFHDAYFAVLMFAVAAYALTGKGFAYAGLPPIFPGEMILAAGLVSFIWPRFSAAVLLSPSIILLLITMAWVLCRTIPYVGIHKIDALRDSVIVVYGLYAVVVANLILEDPARIDRAVKWAGAFFGIFGFSLLGIYILQSVVGSRMPVWPVSDAPFLVVRGGEAAVHLSAAAVFALVGLKRYSTAWSAMLIVSIAFICAISRGGMLSIVIPVLVAALLAQRMRLLFVLGVLSTPLVFVLYVSDLEIAVPQTDRTITVSQLVDNTISIFGSSQTSTLDGTKVWRLLWWETIIDYTFNGPYFWTGKGFGVNLAEADGFNLTPGQDSTLRSPHNGHMTMLARGGVPGFVLWICVNAVWILTMLRHCLVARLRGDRDWSNLFIFVLCYLLAALIDATFDVALEGPMIGIVFWVMFGVGVALMMTYGELCRRREGKPAIVP